MRMVLRTELTRQLGSFQPWRLLLQGHRRSADSHSFTPAFMWTPHTHLKKTHGETYLHALISDS